MAEKDEIHKLRRVKSHHARKCPHCDSNKWEWLGAVHVTLEELSKYLLVKYRCLKCDNEFLVEEAKRSRYVSDVKRCIHCNSTNIEKTSTEGADIELYRCRKCNAYMAIGETDNEGGPVVVNLSKPKQEKGKF